MERLEIKRINGKAYYYCSEWGWENGKCRRLKQRYLGSSEKILEMIKGENRQAQCVEAEVFQFGLPIALWNEVQTAQVTQLIDAKSQKRVKGLGVGTYLAIAAVNRAIEPVSKEAMWDWFSQTSLASRLPSIKSNDLTSQQFWNNMDKVSPEDCAWIWKKIIAGVVGREQIDLSSISYDGTNYYTFIDTFNVRCAMAKRGKNKQGRSNLRQVNYSLFCTADGQMPLFYDVYDGNINDYTQFPVVLKRFQDFFQTLAHSEHLKEKTTLVFDKGNCSKDNFAKIDESGFYFVTSAKLDEHPELASILNNDERFVECAEDLDRTKAFRVRKEIHSKQRTVIVTYNANLFDAQWATLQTDIDKAIHKLSNLSQKLNDQAVNRSTRGKKITEESVPENI
jgi:transposase